MQEIQKAFDDLVRFAIEHGGTLKNHKKFGEKVIMFRALLADKERELQTAEQVAEPDPKGRGDNWEAN